MPRPSMASGSAPWAGSPLGTGPLRRVAGAALGAAALSFLDPVLGAGSVLFLPLLAARGGRTGTLENETRCAIYEHVRDHPGTPIAGVAATVGVSHSTATYHLDTLAEAGLVVSMEDGNKRRFFPNADAYSEAERRCLAVLENEGTRRALTRLAEAEPTSRSRMAAELDVSIPTVNWHLERLDVCGFLDEEDRGGEIVLKLRTDAASEVLQSLLEKLEGTSYDAVHLRTLADDLAA